MNTEKATNNKDTLCGTREVDLLGMKRYKSSIDDDAVHRNVVAIKTVMEMCGRKTRHNKGSSCGSESL